MNKIKIHSVVLQVSLLQHNVIWSTHHCEMSPPVMHMLPQTIYGITRRPFVRRIDIHCETFVRGSEHDDSSVLIGNA